MQKMLWLLFLLFFKSAYAEVCPDPKVEVNCVSGHWSIVQALANQKWFLNYGTVETLACDPGDTLLEVKWKHASYSSKVRGAFCQYELKNRHHASVGTIILKSKHYVHEGNNWHQLSGLGFFCEDAKDKCIFNPVSSSSD